MMILSVCLTCAQPTTKLAGCSVDVFISVYVPCWLVFVTGVPRVDMSVVVKQPSWHVVGVLFMVDSICTGTFHWVKLLICHAAAGWSPVV
jgi:hypothetical protein